MHWGFPATVAEMGILGQLKMQQEPKPCSRRHPLVKPARSTEVIRESWTVSIHSWLQGCCSFLSHNLTRDTPSFPAASWCSLEGTAVSFHWHGLPTTQGRKFLTATCLLSEWPSAAALRHALSELQGSRVQLFRNQTPGKHILAADFNASDTQTQHVPSMFPDSRYCAAATTVLTPTCLCQAPTVLRPSVPSPRKAPQIALRQMSPSHNKHTAELLY